MATFTVLRFHRCQNTEHDAMFEWTIGDYYPKGGCGELGEICLVLREHLGVQVRAFVDGRDALREFLDTGAFNGMGLHPSIADVEDQLVLAGIYAFDPHKYTQERQEEDR